LILALSDASTDKNAKADKQILAMLFDGFSLALLGAGRVSVGMPTPHTRTRPLVRLTIAPLLTALVALPLSSGRAASDDVGSVIERSVATTMAPTSIPAPTTSLRPPSTTVPAPLPPLSPATTASPSTVPAATSTPGSTTGSPSSARQVNIAWFIALFIGLAGTVVFLVLGLRGTARLSRSHAIASTQSSETDGAAIVASDAASFRKEIRLMFAQLPKEARSRMTIQFVAVSADSLEVSFTEVTEVAPPANWLSTADRVWRLTEPSRPETLDEAAQLPAVLPALLPFGQPANGNQLYFNAGGFDGLNVVGEQAHVTAWLAHELRWLEREPGQSCTVVQLTDNGQVCDDPVVMSEAAALDLAFGRAEPRRTKLQAPAPRNGSKHPQVSFAEGFLVVGPMSDVRWKGIASQPTVALLSSGSTIFGTDLIVLEDEISLPSLGINALLKRPAAHRQSDEPKHPADEQSSAQELPWDDSTLADGWRAPCWPVTVHLIGVPYVTRNGAVIQLTPQQLSAVALIATKQRIPAHEFKRAIWGDDEEVSSERVRDLLSELRKKVGGYGAIPKRQDGVVRAGTDLGSDLVTCQTLVDRADTVATERAERMEEVLGLVRGRPFDIGTDDAKWWRWSEIAFGMTDWATKTADIAAELAQMHLDQTFPSAARTVIERGLIADPLNAELTELLIETLVNNGTPEAARRLYRSHDKMLEIADLGGAAAETLRVLERLQISSGSN